LTNVVARPIKSILQRGYWLSAWCNSLNVWHQAPLQHFVIINQVVFTNFPWIATIGPTVHCQKHFGKRKSAILEANYRIHGNWMNAVAIKEEEKWHKLCWFCILNGSGELHYSTRKLFPCSIFIKNTYDYCVAVLHSFFKKLWVVVRS